MSHFFFGFFDTFTSYRTKEVVEKKEERNKKQQHTNPMDDVTCR